LPTPQPKSGSRALVAPAKSSGVTALRKGSQGIAYRFGSCKTLGPNPSCRKEQGPHEGMLGFLLEGFSKTFHWEEVLDSQVWLELRTSPRGSSLVVGDCPRSSSCLSDWTVTTFW